MTVDNNLDFEQVLVELEGIINHLENGDLPLDKALEDFEKGINLVQQGKARLNNAEQRIQILLQKNKDVPLDEYQSANGQSADQIDESSNDIPF